MAVRVKIEIECDSSSEAWAFEDYINDTEGEDIVFIVPKPTPEELIKAIKFKQRSKPKSVFYTFDRRIEKENDGADIAIFARNDWDASSPKFYYLLPTPK